MSGTEGIMASGDGRGAFRGVPFLVWREQRERGGETLSVGNIRYGKPVVQTIWDLNWLNLRSVYL